MPSSTKSKPLFDDDSSSASDSDDSGDRNHKAKDVKSGFQVNKKFAKEYQTKKQLEELRRSETDNKRNKDNGDDNDDDDSDSDDESEDEDGELLTPNLDVSILKTINALRRKDVSIYDPNAKFFDDSHVKNDEDDSDNDDAAASKRRKTTTTTSSSSQGKKKHFKDVLREQILDQIDQEEQGRTVSNEDEIKNRLEYDAEQKDLRSAFLGTKNQEDGDDDDDDDDDEILVVKKRAEPISNEELEKEYEALRKTTTAGDLKDPRGEVEDADRFLLDFLKNKKWVDKDDDDDPMDDEDNEPRKRKTNIIGIDDDEDSIDEVDRADDFESKFNFRFEEAQSEIKSGADFSVVGYARSGTMDTLRRKDDTRRQKRMERQERKAAERKAKEEQLRRLKNAKRQEMESKLNEIKKVIGSAQDVDEDALMKLMEGDYDPEKFEKLMQDTYGEDFYEKEETQWKSDLDVRASLLQDEDGNMLVGEDDVEGGLYDNNDDDDQGDDGDEEDAEYYGEDDDVDGDYGDDELQPADSMIEQKLKTKLQEELYKLDYEDIVAGMPTRFKYRKVERNNFGLSTQEILLARDTTLKNFVSLKKIAPYRDDGEYAVGYKKRRRFRDMLTEDLQEMAKEQGIVEKDDNKEAEGEDEAGGKKKRRRQKKGKKRDESGKAEESTGHDEDNHDHNDTAEHVEKKNAENVESGKKKRRKKKGKKGQVVADESTDADTPKLRKSEKATKVGTVDESPDQKTESIKKPVSSKTKKVTPSTKESISSSTPLETKTEKITEKNKMKKRKRKADGVDDKKNRKHKTSKKSKIEGISTSRLQAYGL